MTAETTQPPPDAAPVTQPVQLVAADAVALLADGDAEDGDDRVTFKVASGATHHHVENPAHLVDTVPGGPTVLAGGNHPHRTVCTGTFTSTIVGGRPITITKANCVPTFGHNLISVDRIVAAGGTVHFSKTAMYMEFPGQPRIPLRRTGTGFFTLTTNRPRSAAGGQTTLAASQPFTVDEDGPFGLAALAAALRLATVSSVLRTTSTYSLAARAVGHAAARPAPPQLGGAATRPAPGLPVDERVAHAIFGPHGSSDRARRSASVYGLGLPVAPLGPCEA
mmetsp:Transcript_25404/g.101231  ORF Transcript_25404/g.101231 Transcript_25404/m.101231 type:complete len:279 (-) Transcript_25404:341-1177(-)